MDTHCSLNPVDVKVKLRKRGRTPIHHLRVQHSSLLR